MENGHLQEWKRSDNGGDFWCHGFGLEVKVSEDGVFTVFTTAACEKNQYITIYDGVLLHKDKVRD